MKIRKGTKKDAEELIQVFHIADGRPEEIVRMKIEKSFKKKDGFFLLAIENKKIIGYVRFVSFDEEVGAEKFVNLNENACVCWIGVLPDFWKNGIGSLLLKEVEQYAKKYHKKGIWLGCREGVIGFYEKNGYANKGNYLRKTSSGKMKPYYIMVKEIE